MEIKPGEFIRRSAVVLTMSGMCLSLAGCWGDNSTETQPARGSVSELIDRDGDGAINTVDPYPDVANPGDWDVDGILNSSDLHPYTSGTSETDLIKLGGESTPIPQVTTPLVPVVPNNGGVVRNGCPSDSDCDSILDSVDPYPNIYDPSDKVKVAPQDDDWDDDGLQNYRDRSPHNSDRDNDGKLDGYDPDPDNANDGTNESSDDNPYVDDKDHDNDGYDDVYDSAPRDPYEH